MVPLIQDEIVDKRKWIDKEDFIDLLALAQSVPGIFAVNIAIFIGYKLRNFRGVLCLKPLPMLHGNYAIYIR